MSKRIKIRRRIDKYYGEGTWNTFTDERKRFMISLGAYPLWSTKQANTIPSLEKLTEIETSLIPKKQEEVCSDLLP